MPHTSHESIKKFKWRRHEEVQTLEACLAKPATALISNYMRTSLKILRKHLPFIENSFIYPYNNGRIEGINNKIKVLNRVAYGYRNFANYKKRILIHFKLKAIDSKSVKINQKPSHAKAA